MTSYKPRVFKNARGEWEVKLGPQHRVSFTAWEAAIHYVEAVVMTGGTPQLRGNL